LNSSIRRGTDAEQAHDGTEMRDLEKQNQTPDSRKYIFEKAEVGMELATENF
jgi:hypothetical protein